MPWLVKLRFSSSLKGREIGSDTIFGALCWAYRLLYGRRALERDWIEPSAHGEPPFLLSSAFPFAEVAAREVLYLPLPQPSPPPPAEELEAIERGKLFAKLRFVTADLFEGLIRGELTPARISAALSSAEDYQWEGELAEFLAGSGFLVPRGYVEEAYTHFLGRAFNDAEARRRTVAALTGFRRSAEIMRNTVDRLRGAVEEGLYWMEETFFQGGGLYFLLESRGVERERLEAVLRFLGDKGLGGESSTGHGQFSFEVAERSPFSEPQEGERLLTLSLYYPTAEEWERLSADEGSYYALEKRRGQVENAYVGAADIRKRAVIFLAEGSLFPQEEGKSVYGESPVVKRAGEWAEGFDVLQFGFAYPVRFVGGGGDEI